MKEKQIKELKRIIAEATEKVILQETSKYYMRLVSEQMKTKRIVIDEEAGVSDEVRQYADIIMRQFLEKYNRAQFYHKTIILNSGEQKEFVERVLKIKNPIEDLESINFKILEFTTKEDFDIFGRTYKTVSSYTPKNKNIKIESFYVLNTNDFSEIRGRLEHELMHFFIDKKTNFKNYRNNNSDTLYDAAINRIKKTRKGNSSINFAIAQLIYTTDKNEVQANCQKLGYEISEKDIYSFNDLKKRSKVYENLLFVEKLFYALKFAPHKVFTGNYKPSFFNNMSYESILNYISIKISYLRAQFDRTASVFIDRNNETIVQENLAEKVLNVDLDEFLP